MTGDETAGTDRFGLDAEVTNGGAFTRRLAVDMPEMEESSFATDLLLREEKSDEEDDTVETDGGAGYLERLACLSASVFCRLGTTGAEVVL